MKNLNKNIVDLLLFSPWIDRKTILNCKLYENGNKKSLRKRFVGCLYRLSRKYVVNVTAGFVKDVQFKLLKIIK